MTMDRLRGSGATLGTTQTANGPHRNAACQSAQSREQQCEPDECDQRTAYQRAQRVPETLSCAVAAEPSTMASGRREPGDQRRRRGGERSGGRALTESRHSEQSGVAGDDECRRGSGESD